MILADSSVWIDHLRTPVPSFVALLEAGSIAIHPYVIGELALGSLANRGAFLADLADLRTVPVASPSEVAALIESAPLHGRGIGYVDACLLASVLITPGSQLLTGDRRLREIAGALGVAA